MHRCALPGRFRELTRGKALRCASQWRRCVNVLLKPTRDTLASTRVHRWSVPVLVLEKAKVACLPMSTSAGSDASSARCPTGRDATRGAHATGLNPNALSNECTDESLPGVQVTTAALAARGGTDRDCASADTCSSSRTSQEPLEAVPGVTREASSRRRVPEQACSPAKSLVTCSEHLSIGTSGDTLQHDRVDESCQRPTPATSSTGNWDTEQVERLSIAELLRVEPSSLEDYERLLVETKVAAANAESERERLEYQVQSLRKRVLELETALDATREAYEALKLKSLRLSDEVETLQRRNRALELRLYDLDGEWNRGRNTQREGTSKATGL